MQLHNDYIVLAKGVTTDTDDQMVSLFKLIDELSYDIQEQQFKELTGVNPGDKVILPASVVVASAWHTDKLLLKETPLNVVLSIVSPSGEKMGDIENSVFMSKGKKRIKFNIILENIPLSSSGAYSFVVEVKNEAGDALGKTKTSLDVILNFQKTTK